MDLEKKTIEEYFLGLNFGNCLNKFPSNQDYITRYKNNSNTMNNFVHPQIEKGAMIIDKGCLNNHGVKHINTVILRATQLLSTDGVELTHYEIYVLLMAIHLHDVGNLTGRKGHDQKINQIITIIEQNTASLTFEDEVEKDCIVDIAEAHGGDNSKMIHLDKDAKILGHHVNMKLIASIIRMADEISDDYDRADRILLLAGTLPQEALIYHKYSFCLKTAEYIAASKIISYVFDVEEVDFRKKFPKFNKETEEFDDVYLIDEIYERTMKTFLELVFCSKFFRPFIQIDKIRVYISIKLDAKNKYGKREKRTIQYDIDDLGYPVLEFKTQCPKIAKLSGKKIEQLLTKNRFKDVKC